MIIYNVTINIEASIENDWVRWMKDIHIQDVMNTNCFLEYRFSKVLSDHGGDGSNYSVQYLCNSMGNLEDYQRNFAPKLQKEHILRYGDKALAFRTLLEVIE